MLNKFYSNGPLTVPVHLSKGFDRQKALKIFKDKNKSDFSYPSGGQWNNIRKQEILECT